MSFNSRAETARALGENTRVERSFESDEQMVAFAEKIKDPVISFPDEKPKRKSRVQEKKIAPAKGKEKAKLNKTEIIAAVAFVVGLLAFVSFTIPFAQTLVWGWLTPAVVKYLATFFIAFGGLAGSMTFGMWLYDVFKDRRNEKKYKEELKKTKKKK